MYPQRFDTLIHELNKLPGIGMKSAERMAFAMMDWSEERRNALAKAILDANKVSRCKVCGNLTDDDECLICADESRDRNIICVVQNEKDLYAIEGLQEFNGVYHVLHGLINLNKGILPENLNIQSLENRVTEDTKEVILALDPTMEGETTSLYLEKLLSPKTTVSRLAYGIPMGGKLDYADQRTLQKALEGRIKSKPE